MPRKKSKFDILGEAEGILYESGKPEWWDVEDWQALPVEARALHCRCEELVEKLPDKFHEAVRKEEWRQALLIYMAHNRKPWLPLCELNFDTMERYWEKDIISKFIAAAKEWIKEAEELLA